MTRFSEVLMASIWRPSRQMSVLGNMGTQSSAGRQALDKVPEATQEDVKQCVHSYCPWKYVYPANDDCDRQTPMITM